MVSAGQLRGSRFQRLFPDVYVLASSTPDLAVRSLAAHVLVEGCGVLAGYSAAELLGRRAGPTTLRLTLKDLEKQFKRTGF